MQITVINEQKERACLKKNRSKHALKILKRIIFLYKSLILFVLFVQIQHLLMDSPLDKPSKKNCNYKTLNKVDNKYFPFVFFSFKQVGINYKADYCYKYQSNNKCKNKLICHFNSSLFMN